MTHQLHWTEAAIAARLAGKFYLVNGRDRNAIEAAEREDEERRKADHAIRQYHKQQAERAVAIKGAFTASTIIAVVAYVHQLRPDDITSRSRRQNIIHARQHACALMREFTGRSFQQIANAVKLVDHTTAHWAVKTWQQRGHVYAVEDRKAREMLGVAR